MEEIWKDIKGFENEYQISNFGRVKSLAKIVDTKNGRYSKLTIKERLLKGGSSRQYLTVGIRNKIFYVHHLVWDHFGDAKREGRKIVVDHIDENKTNCRIDNLQLLSHRDNISKHFALSGNRFTGVSKKKNGYGAWIRMDGKSLYLGSFSTPELAHQRYLDKKMEINAR